LLLFVRDVEANTPFGRWLWPLLQFFNLFHDHGEDRGMAFLAGFELFHANSQVFMGGQHLAQPNEHPNYTDAHLYGPLAL
jgi:hypothetical protein